MRHAPLTRIALAVAAAGVLAAVLIVVILVPRDTGSHDDHFAVALAAAAAFDYAVWILAMTSTAALLTLAVAVLQRRERGAFVITGAAVIGALFVLSLLAVLRVTLPGPP